MRVHFTLPQDAVPDENPHRSVEMPGTPRVGDLIGYSDQKNYLVVKSVVWEIGRTDSFVDVSDGPDCTLDWNYVE